MVRIYRANDANRAKRAGYEARYVADLVFRNPLDTCGVILVDIDSKERSVPHAHERLEEVFIAVTDIVMYINDMKYSLNEGDVVIVEPGEAHSFQTINDQPSRILALKFPNLSDDKVVPVRGSED
jgi:quercetin dioxygenase-like cupin family protein